MASFLSSDQTERHRTYWSMAPGERPLVGCNIGFYMPQAYPTLVESLPRGQIQPEDIRVDLFLRDCERLYQNACQLGDDYPFVGAAFIYLPWMEAIMGCPVFASDTSIYAEPAVEDWTTYPWERPSLTGNPWARKLLELTQALIDHSAGRYSVAATLMRGPADILSAMRGADRFPMDFYDCQDAVIRAAELCADVWIEVGKAQLDLVPASMDGYIAGAHGLRTWAPDKVIWLQEDAMALLSPRIYRRFILPLDRRIASEFPCTAFHLHGSALWAAADLASVPEIDVIELNFESAQCDVDGTFAAWRQIQQAKPLVIWKEFRGDEYWPWLQRVLDELTRQGLSIQITVASLQEGQMVVSRTLRAAVDSQR